MPLPGADGHRVQLGVRLGHDGYDPAQVAKVVAFLDLTHRLRLELDARARESVGLTFVQAQMLCLLDLAGGVVSIAGLSAATGRRSHTISARVNALEHRGLVARRPSGADRRGVEVRLTAHGLDHLRRFREAAARVIPDLFTIEQLDHVVERLDDMVSRFQEGSSSG